VEKGGGLFYADLLMPGRIAHGEAWAWDRLELSLELRVGKALVLRERFDSTGPELAELASLAGSGKEACFGNAVYVPAVDDVEPAWVDALAGLHGDGLWLGVSRLRAAGWSIKFVAESSLRLREALASVRMVLATAEPRLGCDARKL